MQKAKKSMKVLLLTNRYLPVIGGAERQAEALATGLSARGHLVQVVTRRVTAELERETVIAGVPVRRLSPVGLSKRANLLIVFRVIAYLLWHGRRYDVIHTFGVGPVGLAAVIAGRLIGRPVILRGASPGAYQQGDHPGIQPPLYTRLLRRYVLTPGLWRRVLAQAAARIAISQQIEAELDQLGLPAHRIPNGIDVARWHPAESDAARAALRASLGIPPDVFAVMFTGRLVAGKRIDVLIDALAHLPEQVHLYLAGSGDHQIDDVTAALQAQVMRLGLMERVHFLGLIDRVPAYLRAADAFAFASMREGMPNTVLEAMACGVPVVASDIDGVRDVLPDAEYGWLCPAGDVSCFARSLRVVLDDPAAAEMRRQRSLERVQTVFTLDQVVEQYLALYRRVC